MLRSGLLRPTLCATVLTVVFLTAFTPSLRQTIVQRQPPASAPAGATLDAGPRAPEEAPAAPEGPKAGADARLSESYGKLPLRFEPNVGQTDARAKYLARGGGYTLFLTDSEAVLSLRRNSHARGSVLRMRLAGALAAPEVSGLEELPGRTNYVRGGDPASWRTGVEGYAKVLYRGVYEGTDLVYYGNQQRLEYDFRLAPGADPSRIRLSFEGQDSARVDAQGDLVLRLAGSEVRQLKPFAYQEDASGARVEVAARYRLKAKGVVEFELGAYDATRPLVIDPVLAYSTYLGGGNTDNGYGIDVDAAGNAYVTGSTVSADFPTTAGSFQPVKKGATDAFVTKLNPSGSALIYSTFLGGANTDVGRKIVVDADGNAYIVGSTNSPDFPTTPGAYQRTKTGTFIFDNNIFVTKLNAAGDALLYSTYIGPQNNSASGSDIAVDANGNAYVTGSTDSPYYPTTPGAPQPVYGGGTSDAVVTKLNATGSALVYSTYLGGSTGDGGTGIVVDAAGNAYVVGSTNSPDFPTTPGTFQTANRGGNTDEAFVTKYTASGMGRYYSTYLGGSSLDYGHSVAIDAAGNAYVTGYTHSPNFPTTPGAFQPNIGRISPSAVAIDAYVAKLNAGGTGLIYSTFLGGASGNDIGNDIRLDADLNACIVGQSNAGSGDYPTTPDAFQLNTVHDNDAVVTKLNADGTALIYSTYIGGVGSNDTGAGIAVDRLGSIYITGTAIKDWPVTPGAFMTVDKIETEAYVSKFDLTQGYAATVSPSVRQVIPGQSVTFNVSVLGSGGFAGTVTFSTGTLPRGVSATFNPPTVNGSGSSTLTISTLGDTVEETYPLTVRATTPGGPANSAPITVVVASSRPPVAYTITDLGTLGGPASISSDVNMGGDVAGAASFDARNIGHAFLRQNGVMSDLGTLGGLASEAYALNDAGDVVGYSTVFFGGERPFLYRGGVLTDLGSLGNPNDYTGVDSAATDINNAGDIVGFSRLPDNVGAAQQAFLYRNGVMTKLPVGADSNAWGINNNGDVVGLRRPGTNYYHAFLYHDSTGTFAELGTLLPSGQDGESVALDVNDTGQVVGFSQYSGGGAYGHAFLWENGVMRDLGSLGGLESSARAINSAGIIVGFSDNANSSDFATHSSARDRRAFVYRDGAMTNLNTLIDAALGWTLVEAQGINAHGQIVGKGIIGGTTHAFLLNPLTSTPTPTPTPTPTSTPTPTPTPNPTPTPQPGAVTVSGQVTERGVSVGGGVAGITITLSGDASATTQTDAGGGYSFAGLQPGGAYTVTAAAQGWRFSPASRTYLDCRANKLADFEAVVETDEVTTPEPIIGFVEVPGDPCDDCDPTGPGDAASPDAEPTHFVVQQYLDFLGRGPDSAGLKFWRDEIESCGSNQQCREVKRINVSAAFFHSIEFQETVYLVHRLRKVTDGSAPRYGEFVRSSGEVAAGLVVGREGWQAKLAANRRAFVERWAQSPEFRSRYDSLTDEQFVAALLANAGSGEGSAAELVAGLKGGTLTRVDVLLRVAEDEGLRRAEFNRAFVRMQYFGYLRRDPDEEGYGYWLAKLERFNGNFVEAEMVKAFLDSDEYRRRFAPQ